MSGRLPVTRRMVLAALCASVAGVPQRVPAQTTVARGSAVLPTDARRVVAVEFLQAETLALLGRPPIGMADPGYYPSWIGVQSEALAGVADIGTRQQPSLEAIARLEPDLILSVAYRHAPIFDVLDDIAPTVLFDFEAPPGGTLLDAAFATTRRIGELTGLREAAEELCRTTEAALSAKAEAIPSTGTDRPTVAVLHELPGADTYWVLTADSLAAGVASRLGLRFWPDERHPEGLRSLDPEELLSLDDISIGLVSSTGPTIGLEEKTASPLWRRAPALRHGRVSLVPMNIWAFGGLGSALRLADALAEVARRDALNGIESND